MPHHSCTCALATLPITSNVELMRDRRVTKSSAGPALREATGDRASVASHHRFVVCSRLHASTSPPSHEMPQNPLAVHRAGAMRSGEQVQPTTLVVTLQRLIGPGRRPAHLKAQTQFQPLSGTVSHERKLAPLIDNVSDTRDQCLHSMPVIPLTCCAYV